MLTWPLLLTLTVLLCSAELKSEIMHMSVFKWTGRPIINLAASAGFTRI